DSWLKRTVASAAPIGRTSQSDIRLHMSGHAGRVLTRPKQEGPMLVGYGEPRMNGALTSDMIERLACVVAPVVDVATLKVAPSSGSVHGSDQTPMCFAASKNPLPRSTNEQS